MALFRFNGNLGCVTVPAMTSLSKLQRFSARSFYIFGVITLAGCADMFASRPVEVAAPSPPAPRPHAVATAPAPAAEPEAKPKRPAAKRPTPAAAEAARAPGDTQTAAVPVPAPADLQAPKVIGLTQQETVSLLGVPSAQWDRPPARVWHYQGPDCAVDVFFYLDLSRNEFSALRYTAAGADGASSPGQTCLTRIRDVAQRK